MSDQEWKDLMYNTPASPTPDGTSCTPPPAPVDNGGPAFPVLDGRFALPGMTLRDYAELQVMTGLVGNWDASKESMIACAKAYADLWLKARKL